MSKTEVDLGTIRKATDKIIKTAVKADEHAIAEYVRNVCERMAAVGEDLKQYNLVRTVDNRYVTEMRVVYSIERKEPTHE